MIKVIIVDHQKDFTEGIKTALSIQNKYEIVGLGKDGCDAVSLADKYKPDIALLGFDLPFLNALKVNSSIKVHSPKTATLVLANTNDYETIIEIIKYGISGCILRKTVFEELNTAIYEILEKGYYFSDEINKNAIRILSDCLKNDKNNQDPYAFLAGEDPLPVSKIELKMISLIGSGLSNKEISKKLDLKEGTVRNYISSIMGKLELNHRTQIAIYSIALGYSDTKEFFEIYKKTQARK